MLSSVLTWLSIGLELLVLVALTRRRRLRRLVTLPVLLLLVAFSTLAPRVEPAWNTWQIWLASEMAHVLLLLVMGLELALRLCVRLPAARHDARTWIVAVLVIMGVAVLLAGPTAPTQRLLPVLVLAVVSIYVGLLSISRNHVIPVDPLHQTVLHGFTLYLLIYAVSWTLTGERTTLTTYVTRSALNLLLLALLRAAWRDDLPRDADRETLLYFWPWRRFEQRDEVPARSAGVTEPRTAVPWDPAWVPDGSVGR